MGNQHHPKWRCKLSVHIEINSQETNNEMDCEIVYCLDFDCWNDIPAKMPTECKASFVSLGQINTHTQRTIGHLQFISMALKTHKFLTTFAWMSKNSPFTQPIFIRDQNQLVTLLTIYKLQSVEGAHNQMKFGEYLQGSAIEAHSSNQNNEVLIHSWTLACLLLVIWPTLWLPMNESNKNHFKKLITTAHDENGYLFCHKYNYVNVKWRM